jgi:hypothetical protein
MLSPSGQEGWREVIILAVISFLAVSARMAAQDPPPSVARTIWLLVGGLGLATGGWLIARSFGAEGWSAMAAAWVFGAVGSDILLPILRRWLESRLPPKA